VRNQYGTTFFLTTHYIDEAESVDTVCIINHGKITSCCSPDEMKSKFLRQEIVVDSENREALLAELTKLQYPYTVIPSGKIIVPFQGKSAQKMISELSTPLSVLKIHEPTLEDAYIEFLNQKEEN
jgi:ABC-2 type transport system ATP-binding protein